MADTSLATKYRPQRFSDVVEQDVIKTTLGNQIKKRNFKNCLLFCGGAGTGKTTNARIFANEINNFQGRTIEIDAASHNGVDDARRLIEDSKTQSLDSEYKTFLIDECHMMSVQAWNALLKLLEEPPKKSIFLFCTTDPQKIPPAVLSRLQRYDFQRISLNGIINRLKYIIESENAEEVNDTITFEDSALEYIAKRADGGMRDAITLLENAIGYNSNLTLNNVLSALGSAKYDTMFDLTDALNIMDKKKVIEIIEAVHYEGIDLKQFMKQYSVFVLELCKYDLLRSFEFIQMPTTYLDRISKYSNDDFAFINQLLGEILSLNNAIKYETVPKPLIESTLLLLCMEA